LRSSTTSAGGASVIAARSASPPSQSALDNLVSNAVKFSGRVHR
jgi:hypothetical protein